MLNVSRNPGLSHADSEMLTVATCLPSCQYLTAFDVISTPSGLFHSGVKFAIVPHFSSGKWASQRRWGTSLGTGAPVWTNSCCFRTGLTLGMLPPDPLPASFALLAAFVLLSLCSTISDEILSLRPWLSVGVLDSAVFSIRLSSHMRN